MEKLTKSSAMALLAVILLTVSPMPARAVGQPSSMAAQGTAVQDEQALRSQAQLYAAAFVRGDAPALASMWTADGTFTDTTGRQWIGRQAIEQYFAGGFKRFGGLPLEINVESIRFPAPGVAIEQGRSRVRSGPNAASVSHYTVLHVKINGTWQMAAVSDVDYLPLDNVALSDFAWLIGSWTGQAPTTGSVHIKAEWVANHNFISCQYRANPQDPAQDVQLIGWDAAKNRIASWHFDLRGGHGYGNWIKDGNTFIERARSVEPDGVAGSGVYVFNKLNDNAFNWHSTGRTLAGKALPDSQEITVTRDQQP